MDENCCCHTKSSTRDEALVKKMQSRLNVIIGQLNGIKSMLDENRYCGDILIQISAVEASLKSIGEQILKDHMSTCVVEKIKEGDENIIDETLDLIKRLK